MKAEEATGLKRGRAERQDHPTVSLLQMDGQEERESGSWQDYLRLVCAQRQEAGSVRLLRCEVRGRYHVTWLAPSAVLWKPSCRATYSTAA